MKRRVRFSFTDKPTTSKAICNSCYNNNIDSKLVPYTKDPSFMICPWCSNIVSKKSMRFEALTEPLGSKGGIGQAVFEVVNPSKSRSRKYRESEPDFDIPKFGNFEDRELKQMVTGGAIVVSITDDNLESPEQS